MKWAGETHMQRKNRLIWNFLLAYLTVLIPMLLVSFDGFSFESTVTAVAATQNNIGPGLGTVGLTGSYFAFSGLSKVVLIFDMIAGRLEIFPMIILFAPSTWRRK